MRLQTALTDQWLFRKGAAVPESCPEDWDSVQLPHTWNALDGQDGGDDYWRGTGVYARCLKRSELPRAEEHFLEICGANASATVYLNGEKLGAHDGGYSTWRVRLTGALREENLLVIAVDNAPNDRVYPQMADFTFYGGLYRDVRVISVPREHFELLRNGTPAIKVTPKADLEKKCATVEVETWHNASAAEITVNGETKRVERSATFLIPDVRLWDGKNDPFLYTAYARLDSGDEVSTRFGCRSYHIDPQKGFFLNGRSYPLHGVSRHQDWEGLGNALLSEHHRRDVDLICEMGANAVRLAHYQHDQLIYDLCDERGLVVWAEIPYISRHMDTGEDNTLSQLRELIEQNYNHPSIVVWGISNEVTISGAAGPEMLENHRRLNELAHRMDQTRPTAMAVLGETEIGSEYAGIPDCIGFNTYLGWYKGSASQNGPLLDGQHLAKPAMPMAISEYGCEGLNYHNANPGAGDYSEEYQALFHESLIAQIKVRPYLWATFVWNMFDFGSDRRDEGGVKGRNNKGLVSFDRSYCKDAFYLYKAWLSDAPFVHICGKRYADRAESPTEIKVYSNQKTVELLVNGLSVGTQESENGIFRFLIPLEGECRLCARSGELYEEATICKTDRPNPAYTFGQAGSVLNWFEVAGKADRFSLNSRVEELLADPDASEIFLSWLAECMKQNPRIPKEPSVAKAVLRQMLGQWSGMNALGLLNSFAKNGLPIDRESMLKLNAELEIIRKG